MLHAPGPFTWTYNALIGNWPEPRYLCAEMISFRLGIVFTAIGLQNYVPSDGVGDIFR